MRKSEMTASELATRPAFQVFFKCSRLAFRFERNRSFDLPRPVLGSVLACAPIVFPEALIEVARNGGVVNGLVSLTDQNINVEERAHLLARQAVVFGAAKPKPKIRPAFGLPLRSKAKAGPAWIRTRDQGIMSPLLYR